MVTSRLQVTVSLLLFEVSLHCLRLCSGTVHTVLSPESLLLPGCLLVESISWRDVSNPYSYGQRSNSDIVSDRRHGLDPCCDLGPRPHVSSSNQHAAGRAGALVGWGEVIRSRDYVFSIAAIFMRSRSEHLWGFPPFKMRGPHRRISIGGHFFTSPPLAGGHFPTPGWSPRQGGATQYQR